MHPMKGDNMKHTLRIALVLMLALVLAGCSKDKSANKTEKTTQSLADAAMAVMQKDLMNKADDDLTKGLTGLDLSEVAEYTFMMPKNNTQATQILIVKPKEGKMEDVSKKVDAYLANQKEVFKTYVEDEYKLLEKAERFNTGDMVILLVGEGASDAKAKIEE